NPVTLTSTSVPIDLIAPTGASKPAEPVPLAAAAMPTTSDAPATKSAQTATPSQGFTQIQGPASSISTDTGSDPSGDAVSAMAAPVIAVSTTPSEAAVKTVQAPFGDPPGDYNSVFGKALN